ncbi:MAG: hypothetical protein V7754_14635 [Halioglobus sp.]
MKSLAEFVMRGRLQALLVVVIGASSLMFSWVSAAVVALVTLRKGAGQGAWLLLWALLPAVTLLVMFKDSGPLATLVGTSVLALVLRTTVSLSLTLLASVVVGVLSGLAVIVFGGDMLDQMVTFFAEFLTQLEQQIATGGEGAESIVLQRPNALQIAGMLGLVNAMGSVMCLLLARWWQAALYNPGGFGQEFRTLRMSPAYTLVLVVPALALYVSAVDYRTWAVIFAVPFTFAGLALVHARAALRGQGSGWLTGFYLMWLFFDPVKLIVVFVAIADSWLNFRQRWVGKPGGHDSDEDRD